MRLDEFYRRQAERFSALAQRCVDPQTRAEVLALAHEYQELLRRRGLRVVQESQARHEAPEVGGTGFHHTAGTGAMPAVQLTAELAQTRVQTGNDGG